MNKKKDIMPWGRCINKSLLTQPVQYKCSILNPRHWPFSPVNVLHDEELAMLKLARLRLVADWATLHWLNTRKSSLAEHHPMLLTIYELEEIWVSAGRPRITKKSQLEWLVASYFEARLRVSDLEGGAEGGRSNSRTQLNRDYLFVQRFSKFCAKLGNRREDQFVSVLAVGGGARRVPNFGDPKFDDLLRQHASKFEDMIGSVSVPLADARLRSECSLRYRGTRS